MVRLDAPLDDATMVRMLQVIAPERNRREYSETNDTDFAYEIAGRRARFRANVFVDRAARRGVPRHPAKILTAEDLGCRRTS